MVHFKVSVTLRHVALFVCLPLAGACTSGTGEPSAGIVATAPETASASANAGSETTPDRAPCAETLPDLSGLGDSVQQQIRQHHAAFPRAAARSAAPAQAQGVAVGSMGMILMAAWLTEEAESCFQEAASLMPNEPRWPYFLAHLDRDRGDLAGAARYFDEVLELVPDDLTTLYWLGDIHLEEGRATEAIQLFERSLVIAPESLSARYGLARASLLAEDYQRAVEMLEEIHERNPDIGAIHYPLGMAYRGLGNDAKAEEHLSRRENAELRPEDPLMAELDTMLNSAGTMASSGEAALEREDWAAAEEQFREALELNPNDPSLRYRLGTALVMQGNLEGALAEFETIVRDAPDYHAAHYSIGVLLQGAGRVGEAVERFETALRYRPGDPEVSLRLAVSLRQSGNPTAALDHYQTVLDVNPNVIEARFGYAMALVQLGRWRQAFNRLETAMAAFPNEIAFPHALTRLLVASPDDAIRDGQRALDLLEQLTDRQTTPTIDVAETMAMTLAEVGQFNEAVSIQRELIGAAEAAELPALVSRLQVNLALYERNQPCRTPWPPGAMP